MGEVQSSKSKKNRFYENNQKLIVNLIAELNKELSSHEQIKLYDFPVDQSQNIAYLRGEHLRLADFMTKPDKVPYNSNLTLIKFR